MSEFSKDQTAVIELIKELAADVGLSVSVKLKTVRKIAAKYRNPENPEQTWTGRGKTPVWARGVDLDNCLI